ncbi:MAG: glycosyltransferase, partial [Candidatus Dadabacteria bacterium]
MSALKLLIVNRDVDRPELYAFKALAERGHQIKVIGSNLAERNRKLLAESGIETETIKIKSRISPAAISYLRNEFKKVNYDLVHYFSSRALSNGLIASKGFSHKNIAYRGTSAKWPEHKWILRHLPADPLSRLTYFNPAIDKIMCVSEAVKEYLLLRGVPAVKLCRIYKGHLEEWYSQPAIARSVLGVPEEAFLVIMVANIRPEKGAYILLEAFKKLVNQLPIHLMLLGEIRCRKTARIISSLSLTEKNRVHLPGYVKEVSRYLKTADVSVLPSLAGEGLPKAILESMYCRVPVIT